MGRRNGLVLAFALICAVTPQAGAVHVIPAVDLPSAVPDSVRDQTARSLALGRDTLGRALHPFRGEFHGLGVHEDGFSYATDLSADGRVVVGSDYDLTSGYRGYVWSPATGKVNYNLLPNGSTGQTLATTVSADGVYVAGEIRSPDTEPGFRWSLAGRELISPPEGTNLQVAAISGNGGVTVGTTATRRQVDMFGDGTRSGDGDGEMGSGDIYVGATRAVRRTLDGELQTIGLLPTRSGGQYHNSKAIDVSSEGKTTLVNAFGNASWTNELFLWRASGDVVPLGLPELSMPLDDPSRPTRQSITVGTAISADGSTVVGSSAESEMWLSDDYETIQEVLRRIFLNPRSPDQAALWREETGWVTLGPMKESISERFRQADDLNGNGNSTIYIGTLPNVDQGDTAIGVSGDGKRVVGIGQAAVWKRLHSLGDNILVPTLVTSSFLWDEQRGMRELTDVLSLDYGLKFDGWSLSEATAISDDGTTIIGNGRNPNGESEAWRAVLDRNTPDGDLDFDGDVDHLDYQTLAANLGLDSDTDAVFYADGDLNADGRVDQEDSDAFLSRYEHRWMGDFNADGLVDLADYTFWRDREGLFTGGLADSNGDGWVNQTDLAAWQTHFGMAIEAIRARAVPEPTALVGFLAGLLPVVCRHQRGCR